MTPKEQIHIHVNCNSLCKNHERFHPFFKHIRCVIFWLKKYVIAQIGFQSYGGHWAGQRRELIYYDCFLFSINTYIHICLELFLCENCIFEFLSWGFVDLCVWIYLVWWAIITCGRKYQLSEVDAHMDQLLLALLIGHLSRARRFSFF